MVECDKLILRIEIMEQKSKSLSDESQKRYEEKVVPAGLEQVERRPCASFILDPSCKRDPKNFLQTGSEPRADTDRFNLFIDNNATSLHLV